jgi:hypothetical protein
MLRRAVRAKPFGAARGAQSEVTFRVRPVADSRVSAPEVVETVVETKISLSPMLASPGTAKRKEVGLPLLKKRFVESTAVPPSNTVVMPSYRY